MKEYKKEKRQTNLLRIKTKNKGLFGKYSKRSILVYACYVVLKEAK